MENAVSNYTFTIIEDGQVPLAGNFNTVSYTPVIMVVAVCLIAAALVGYAFWILAHSRRIVLRDGLSDTEVVIKYFFNPSGLLRDELAVEYALLEASLNN